MNDPVLAECSVGHPVPIVEAALAQQIWPGFHAGKMWPLVLIVAGLLISEE